MQTGDLCSRECGLGLKREETEISAFRNKYSEARMNKDTKKEMGQLLGDNT